MRPLRAPVRTVGPASTLVSVADVKTAQRIDADDEDALIATYIAAASAHVEAVLSRAIVAQTFRHDFAHWNDGELRLGLPDAQTVTVSYTAAGGTTQTLSASLYDLIEDGIGSVIRPKSGTQWPGLADVAVPVSVTAVHGLSSLHPAIQPIRMALLLIVGDWLHNRESVSTEKLISAPVAVSVNHLLIEHRATWMVA